MDKIAAGLEELSQGITQGITQGISQGLSNIRIPMPGRRRSRSGSRRGSAESSITPSRSQSPPEDPTETPPEDGVDFEVEEEQVMKGLELIYQDKLNEADEYFETLKAGHARFSLHHAEVSSYVALMSFEPDDTDYAVSLLKDTAALAVEQARRWRTHSKLKKVAEAAQETVDAMTTWVWKSAATALSKAGPVGAQASAKLMPVENPNIPDDDDDVDIGSFEQVESGKYKRGEVLSNHLARRMRLWALLIQGECHLMTSLLQVVAAGESWGAVVKVGYTVKRTWSIYQHCQSKLKQLQNEWVALGGTYTTLGELGPELNVNYDDEDSDDDAFIMDKPDSGGASTSNPSPLNPLKRCRSQNYDPILAPPSGEMVYEGVRAASGNLEKIESGVKEDQELASLRIGVQFGIGAFNLLISLIPSNYQKAIELMGVPGDRDRGLTLLRKVSSLHHCRAPLAAVILLEYYTIIMGLLPYCEENAIGAKNVLNMLPIAWKESSIFGILQARLVTYECRLQASTKSIEKMYDATANVAEEGGLILKLRSFMLDELGWTLFLQGDFVRAGQKFGALYKNTTHFKPLYAFLQASCYWEADERYHHEASKMLQDMPGMVASKKTTPTAMENFAVHIAEDFITYGQVPLFPALEIIAVYNGFHHMDKGTLERHKDRIGDALINQAPTRASEYELSSLAENAQRLPTVGTSASLSPPGSKTGTPATAGSVMTSHRSIAFQSKSRIPDPEEEGEDETTHALAQPSLQGSRGMIVGNRFQHKWTKESKILCRYLLALCQRSLGDIKQAEANFRYVVGQTDVTPGNIMPYACFEWGSLLLNNEATSPEGLNLLEKSVHFPQHEFQTRLKFVVSERLRMFQRACENDISSAQASMHSALNLRRVSELLRTVTVKEQP
ncbi:unnamed protein product [Calypogeia fissa]